MFELSNKLYAEIDRKYPTKSKDITLHIVNGLIIPFSKTWRNIGINLSGGADSASLAMLLATIIKENNYECKIHTLTMLRCWSTRPWQESIGENVYKKLMDIFPDIVVSRHTTYVPPELEYGVSGPVENYNNKSGDQVIGRSFNGYMSFKLNLDAVFNATSQNPSADGFENRMTQRDKKAENGELVDVFYISDGVAFCHPYRFVQKDWIIAQYFLHDAEDLFNTTRSCEGDIKLNPELAEVVPSFRDYTPGMYVPICNSCFWCLERDWATKQLKKTKKKIKALNE